MRLTDAVVDDGRQPRSPRPSGASGRSGAARASIAVGRLRGLLRSRDADRLRFSAEATLGRRHTLDRQARPASAPSIYAPGELRLEESRRAARLVMEVRDPQGGPEADRPHGPAERVPTIRAGGGGRRNPFERRGQYEPRQPARRRPAPERRGVRSAGRTRSSSQIACAQPEARRTRAPSAGCCPRRSLVGPLDNWGRSETAFQLADPILNFYYRYWFRVEVEGMENVPRGRALLVSNHSGALPPDAPMIMQGVRKSGQVRGRSTCSASTGSRATPGVGMLSNKIGLVAGAPGERAAAPVRRGAPRTRLPRGPEGIRKLYWQRYKLRRFGRGGFVRTAMRAGVPIVPIAVVGAEEAMPIFAHLRASTAHGAHLLPREPRVPPLRARGGAMYLPAKFKIRFLKPVDLGRARPQGDRRGPCALVQTN